VSALIGRHMASLATLMKPMATSSTLISEWCLPEALLDDWLVERNRLISCVSLRKCFIVSSVERGSFSPGPKILGKKEGSKRPRARFASVTVRGPPEPKEKQNKHVPSSECSFESRLYETPTKDPRFVKAEPLNCQLNKTWPSI